jgi:PAS domain S-box-containing protein
MTLFSYFPENNKSTLRTYLCWPIKNELNELEDLYIEWLNPSEEDSNELDILKPGCNLSLIKNAGIELPKEFLVNLHKHNKSSCQVKFGSFVLHFQGIALQDKYVVTIQQTYQQGFKWNNKSLMSAFQNAFFNFTGVGIALTDTKGIIKIVNPALEAMTGFSGSELINKVTPGKLRLPAVHDKQVKELVADLVDKEIETEEAVMAYVSAKGNLQRENTILKKTGEQFTVLSTVSRVYNTENVLLGFADFIVDITELKKTQEQLFLANQRLTVAAQAANLGIWEFDTRSQTFECDNETYSILGLKAGIPFSLNDFINLVHPDDREYMLSKYEAKDVTVAPFRLIHPDGQVKYLKGFGKLIRNERGKVTKAIGVLSDVTESVVAQMALSESEKRYRFLVDNLKEVVFQTDLKGDWTFLNKSWTEITGFALEDSMGINCLEFVHPDDRERNLEYILELVHQKKDYCRHEVRYMHIDGSYRWIEVFAKLTFDSEGQPIGTIGTLYDISERKKMELELKKSENRFKAIFNSSFHFAGLLNPEGHVLEVNQTALAAAGIQIKDVVGKPFWDTYWWKICPSTQQKLRKSIQDAARGKKIHYEVDVWGKNQTPISIDFSITPIMDDEGKVVSLLPEGHDITEIKRIRAALVESEQRFRDIAENVDEFFWIRHNDKPQFIYMNPTYERVTGQSVQNLYNDATSLLEFVVEEDREEVSRLFAINLSEDTNIEFRIITKEKKVRWLLGRIFNISDSKGGIRNKIGVASDITLQKEKELVLMQSLEKEKELNLLKSKFVSFVSHEFRIPLTTIKSSVELIEYYLFNKKENILSNAFTPKIRHHLETINKKVSAFNDLLSSTLTLNQLEIGKVAFNPLPIDLTALVKATITEFFEDRTDSRTITMDVKGQASLVSVDVKLMEQVLVNLISNAFKYSEDNPALRIIYTPNQVRLEIQDRGIGIPQEEIPNLFSTFFRASNVGKISGTGLGLQITKQLVEMHNGQISVSTLENAGTTISVILPIHG